MKRARGFTLVEALISMVVLSLGLLGAVAMLLGSLRSHALALRVVAATGLVRDMAERIRANPLGGASYDTRHGAGSTPDCSVGTECNAAQRAASDLESFSESVRAEFPGADTLASVEFEPATGPALPDQYRITLRWHDPRDARGTDDAPEQAVALQVLSWQASLPVAG